MNNKEKAEISQEKQQAAGSSAQNSETMGMNLATEIIADLKKKLQRAQEEADQWKKEWELLRYGEEVDYYKKTVIGLLNQMDEGKLKISLCFMTGLLSD